MSKLRYVNIPNSVLESSNVPSLFAAYILSHLNSFTSKNKYCYTSNEQFAALMKVSLNKVARTMTVLRKHDLVTQDWPNGIRALYLTDRGLSLFEALNVLKGNFAKITEADSE